MSESDYCNPGSVEARAIGCRCPVLDNNHGKSAPWPPDGWYIVQGCTVHWLASPTEANDE